MGLLEDRLEGFLRIVLQNSGQQAYLTTVQLQAQGK